MKKYLVADFSERQNEDKGLTDFLSNNENATYGREPVIAVMPDGSLCCTFLSGGPTEPHNTNVVIYKKSNDGGKTWSDAKVLFSHSFQGVWVTEICTHFEKPMMVITMYNADYPTKAFQNFVSYTDDCGESWNYPVSIDPMMQSVSVRGGIKMSNNEVLFPLYYQVSDHRFDWDVTQYYKKGWWDDIHSECSVAITGDEGENYQRFGKIKKDTVSLWEPSCIELEDGHIIMFIRSDLKFLTYSESFDYGKTWSELKFTDLKHPGAKMASFKIGKKIGLINNFNSDARKNLSLYISEDNGKTWNFKIDIGEPNELFQYPHVAIDYKNKQIYIAYENFQQHYLKVFTFDELGF